MIMGLANSFYRFFVLWSLFTIALDSVDTEGMPSWVRFFIPSVLALVSGLSNIGDK